MRPAGRDQRNLRAKLSGRRAGQGACERGPKSGGRGPATAAASCAGTFFIARLLQWAPCRLARWPQPPRGPQPAHLRAPPARRLTFAARGGRCKRAPRIEPAASPLLPPATPLASQLPTAADIARRTPALALARPWHGPVAIIHRRDGVGSRRPLPELRRVLPALPRRAPPNGHQGAAHRGHQPLPRARRRSAGAQAAAAGSHRWVCADRAVSAAAAASSPAPAHAAAACRLPARPPSAPA